VQVMAQALKDNPQSYTLLHAQCDFLRSKGKTEWALKLAKQAVNCAPSEFVTWEKLTDVYTELGQYESVSTSQHIFRVFSHSRGGSIGTPHTELMSDVHVQRT
jgi:predicted Zn-dependent protease